MMELLPDLPGTITGIKCKNPFIVQCPTCGDYADPFDYVRLCTSCHRRIDVFRRKEIGRTLSGHVRKEVMPNV